MIFPFSLQFKYKFSRNLDDEKVDKIAEKIRGELTKYKNDNVLRSKNIISFKNNILSHLYSWELFLPIDSGKMTINKSESSILYKVNIVKLPVIALLISLLATYIFHSFYAVLVGIGIFYGINLMVAGIRHHAFLNALGRELEKQ